ncbi:hypothetical protein WMY93_023534 [Mugilogobius chulae]|uniref:EF-hand domain-containing protein n=1 Tax=Mugilogobius chulae TaxID=88201 RepID=A0AAW0N7L0_9GOBI
MATCASNNNSSGVGGGSVLSKVRTAWKSQTSRDEGDLKKNGDATGQNTIAEFFQICDSENKGFITRRDMQRLNSELPLSAEDLENVFDMLDADGNGYLTLEEFSTGFSAFVFGQTSIVEANMEEKSPVNGSAETVYQGRWEERLVGPDDEEEKHFSMLMDSLGANHIFENPTEIRCLWAQLRQDEPHLLSNFEDFLARVTSQLIEANQEKSEMESALKRKAATHDDEIRRLYEEMEQQIKNEKDKIVLQLEHQCQDLHSEQHETKVENVKLKQTNDELARELQHTSQELTLAQEQLLLLQHQSTRLHEEREIEIYRLTEGLQRERASLLKQLDMMREMNKYLRDERDICYQKPKKSSSSTRTSGSPKSITSDVFRSEDEVDTDLRLTSVRSELQRGHLQRIISIEEDHLPHLLQNNCQVQSPLQECSEDEDEGLDLVMSDIIPRTKKHEAPMSPRGQPVGKETTLNEVAGDDIAIMLLGNKTDKEEERQVQSNMGERLAKECQMSFFECSACSGHNVLDSMIHMARILKDHEDREKEKTVNLGPPPSEKKRSCC